MLNLSNMVILAEAFFTNPEVSLATKLLEVIYIFAGLVCIYAAFKNLKDEQNPQPIGTFIFWLCLGILMACGRYIGMLPKGNMINGVIVVLMLIPPILNRVKRGANRSSTKEEQERNYKNIGMKIFVPAFAIGICSLIFAFIPGLSSLVGMGVGVILGMITVFLFNKNNKLGTFFNDAEQLLSLMGPTCILPCMLGVLGSIFTKAGVGEAVASIVGHIIPENNVYIGIIVYALGMMLFTMIMGNAFAAITVMTVGIGGPFVFAAGADPTICGMLALTCGYCGTLCTPMAANFNMIPVAVLEMDDKWGVIKKQIVPAIVIIIFQIAYMMLFGTK